MLCASAFNGWLALRLESTADPPRWVAGRARAVLARAVTAERLQAIVVGGDQAHAGALQALGTPSDPVRFRSYRDDTLGGNVDPTDPSAVQGDWGGLVFRGDSDQEDAGIFLSWVTNSDLQHGGGGVRIGSVEKTFTPDKAGNFSGGSIDLRTKDLPEGRVISFSTSTSYNSNTTGKDNVLTYVGGSQDWLAMGSDSREAPSYLEDPVYSTPDPTRAFRDTALALQLALAHGYGGPIIGLSAALRPFLGGLDRIGPAV